MKNDKREDTMNKNFTILQRINTPHRVLPHTFDEENKDTYSSIYIVKDGDMYGVIDDNDNVFIPCEYDNITVIGFGLLQLVKNGKLGLAHYSRERKIHDAPFYLEELLPCEYDFIDAPWYEEIVVLRKDDFNRMKVRAYFTNIKKLTDWYDDYSILDRDIVEMQNAKDYFLYDARNGKMFFHHNNKSFCTFNAFNEAKSNLFESKEQGIVIYAAGICESLIYYYKDDVRIYNTEGEIKPIAKAMYFENGNRLPAIGFVIKEKDGVTLLGPDCREIFKGSGIDVQTTVIVKNSEDETEFCLDGDGDVQGLLEEVSKENLIYNIHQGKFLN